MKVGTFEKQSGEKRSVSITYDDSLDTDDYIENLLSCTAEPSGLSVVGGLATTKRVRVWAESGANGVSYKITVRVLTHGGEILEDEITCKVKDI